MGGGWLVVQEITNGSAGDPNQSQCFLNYSVHWAQASTNSSRRLLNAAGTFCVDLSRNTWAPGNLYQ